MIASTPPSKIVPTVVELYWHTQYGKEEEVLYRVVRISSKEPEIWSF